jgi:hypothetical protein
MWANFVVFLVEIKLCQGFGQNTLLCLVCPGLKKQLNIFTINEITGIINYFKSYGSHTYVICPQTKQKTIFCGN